MHLEEFSEGKSFLHRRDPRVKILVFLFFSLTCALASGIRTPAIYLVFSFILLAMANLRIRSVFSRILIANFFIAFIWLFIPLSYKGNPYINLGPLKISYEGLMYALSITLKSNAIIIATIALLSTSSVFSLAHAMLHLKMPKKIVTIFFLFYRYITVIHEEYTKIMRAVA
ncbi:MAG: energy-coupling factor transporter transmembrane component T family protein, partial [Caldimicrobium sp.]